MGPCLLNSHSGKNKLFPVDQFLNTSISVLYVRISKLITDMAIPSKINRT